MSRNPLLSGSLIVAMSWLFCTLSVAADMPVPSQQPISPPTPAQSQSNIFVRPDATCLAWSDGCRTCQYTANGEADGDVACSNIGIACQPQAPRCTRRQDLGSPKG